MDRKICYWTVADGDYRYMVKTLAASMKLAGFTEDLYVLSNEPLESTLYKSIKTPINKAHYWFKFDLLTEMVKLPYDYFIFIDCDSYVFRKPNLENFTNRKCFSLLESDCTSDKNKRPDWWGCQLPDYCNLMRSQGVTHEKIYNVNAGFWGVEKNIIPEFQLKTKEFWDISKSKGYNFTEEPPLAYITHLLNEEVETITLKNNPNLWASDWTGNFANRLPEYTSWDFIDYMSNEPIRVKPDIIHCMRSKQALINQGKNITI